MSGLPLSKYLSTNISIRREKSTTGLYRIIMLTFKRPEFKREKIILIVSIVSTSFCGW